MKLSELCNNVKRAIAHSPDDLKNLQSIVANCNYDQRTDGSGSAAEIFLQRSVRVPGLAAIPQPPRDVDSMKAARGSSRQSKSN